MSPLMSGAHGAVLIRKGGKGLLVLRAQGFVSIAQIELAISPEGAAVMRARYRA